MNYIMMKKVFVLAIGALALVACQDKQKFNSAMLQNDSLRAIIEARDNEINDMMGTLNEIQEGFRVINEAEGRVMLAKSGEGANRSAQMKEDIRFIAQRMDENRELIKKLQQQLRETGFKGDQMRKTINDMIAQLAKKDKELTALREELDKKDIHIAELDETINNLNTDVATLQTEKENLTTEKKTLETDNSQKAQTISSQDKQLHTAWYVFGTKSELKEQGILKSGKVLQGSFNKDYFTKIDIRVDKEFKLYSKSAQLLTAHPSSSYNLSKDINGQYVLRVTDPNTFWSTSKYLVIQVK
jgi:archaellum component FlaC